MRRLGLIGGMSWESTGAYYAEINRAVRERLGGLHSADLLLHSVDFAPIEAMQREGRWEAAGEALAASGRRLAAAGAEAIVLCTNTMHRVADAVEHGCGLRVLHIAEAVADAAASRGLDEVLLLGTRYTMEGAFVIERLRGSGLGVVVPEEDDRELVNRVIYDELCLGCAEAASRDALASVVDRAAKGASMGVLLCCTELGLAIDEAVVGRAVIDSAGVHALAAAGWAMNAGGVFG